MSSIARTGGEGKGKRREHDESSARGPATWREWREAVAARVNWPLELWSLGAQLHKPTPTPGGWLKFTFDHYNRKCHNRWYLLNVRSAWVISADKDDPESGRPYFQFAVERGQFRDARAAERYFAEGYGVPLPHRPRAAAETEKETEAAPKLLPRHREHLRASGIDDAAIDASGVRSLTDPAEISRALGGARRGRSVAWAKRLGPCLMIPYFGADGLPTGYSRLRPDRPRRNRDGKPVNYEARPGAGQRAYLPPLARAALKDPKVTLVLTEGEKKGMAADARGLACVGLPGVYGWTEKRPRVRGRPVGDFRLIADLDAFVWDGRVVWIVFDSDGATNPNVRLAARRLAELLRGRGAHVLVAFLPAGPDGEKVGLDDWLLTHEPDELWQLETDRERQVRRAGDAAERGRRLAEGLKGGAAAVLDAGALDEANAGTLAHAAVEALGAATSVTVVPSHDTAIAVAGLLYDRYFKAAAYPQRVPDLGEDAPPAGDNEHVPAWPPNCANWREAGAAESAGFSVRPAVCPGCPLRDECLRGEHTFLKLYAKADDAHHQVMVRRRAGVNFDGFALGKDLVLVLECGEAGDATELWDTVTAADVPECDLARDLASLAEIAGHARDRAGRRPGQAGADAADFFDGMARIAPWLARVSRHKGKYAPPAGRPTPPAWEARLWRAYHSWTCDRGWPWDGPPHSEDEPDDDGSWPRLAAPRREGERVPHPPAGLLQLLMALAAGDVVTLLVCREAGKVRLRGVGKPVETPNHLAVVDPSLTAEALSRVARVPVTDVSRPGAAPVAARVPERVGPKSRPSVLVRHVRKFLASHRRGVVGVLLHGRRLDDVAAALTEKERDRVRLVAWGKSPRGFRGCAHVLALGCYGPSREHVRRRLIREGNLPAAQRGGDWGPPPGGRAKLADGRVLVGQCYREPAWRRVFLEVASGWLAKALAGVDYPVTVVSDLDLNRTAVPLVAGLDDAERTVLKALRDG
jgi:hypothetical protein